jgi:hypothetical protein
MPIPQKSHGMRQGAGMGLAAILIGSSSIPQAGSTRSWRLVFPYKSAIGLSDNDARVVHKGLTELCHVRA